MQKAIMLFIVSAMLLAMPELLNAVQPVAAVTVAEPGTLGAMTSNIQDSMASITSLISAMAYMAGLMFGIKGAIALKQYNETGGSYSYEDKKEEIIEEPKVKIQKTVSSINDKKIELLVEIIKTKSKDLLANPQINNEIELKHIAEKSVSAYLPKVIDTYMAISPELRKKNVKDGLSAHDMTCQQLELIHSGLCEIELKLLSKDHDRLKVSGKFLNQIFKKKDKAEKVIELEM
jgi:hypothetical protein